MINKLIFFITLTISALFSPLVLAYESQNPDGGVMASLDENNNTSYTAVVTVDLDCHAMKYHHIYPDSYLTENPLMPESGTGDKPASWKNCTFSEKGFMNIELIRGPEPVIHVKLPLKDIPTDWYTSVHKINGTDIYVRLQRTDFSSYSVGGFSLSIINSPNDAPHYARATN